MPLLALLTLTAATSAHAVMPPFYEASAALERIESADQQRKQATDVVVVRVGQVLSSLPQSYGCPSKEEWALEGEVVRVLRGTLKPGTLLRVQHTWEHYRCPGPVREPSPTLIPGVETEAFLHCPSSSECTPAAGSMSFIPAEAFTREWEKRKEELRYQRRP